MRLSYRLGSLAALLLLSLFLLNHHLDHLPHGSRSPFWKSSRATTKPPDVYTHRKTKLKFPDSSLLRIQPSRETTEIIVPNDRIIVMARLSSEDTSWVSADLTDWRCLIYTVDDLRATHHTTKNKGREALAYLKYIVDHYHDLPSTIVFLHPHRDGYPQGWHTDNAAFSNVESVRALKLDHVQRNGYVNLRCQHSTDCPVSIRPGRDSGKKPVEKVYKKAWMELFNSTSENEVPEAIGVPCCSQFAVSRSQVLARPLEHYRWFYNWVLETELSDYVASSVLENTWHMIFGQDPIYCPAEAKCYQDVYGIDPMTP